MSVPVIEEPSGVMGDCNDTTHHKPAIVAFCRHVDRLNEGVCWLFGPVIVFVAAAILYEIILRGAFNVGTIWVSETSVYGTAAVYMLAGGYALLHRRHVRIDLVLSSLAPRLGRQLDVIVLPFLIFYLGVLIVVGGNMAWTSFLQGEGTGTPWNPPIWTIKACIPISGVLLLIQTFSNLFRDLGLAPAPTPTSAAPQGSATPVPPTA
jgi:TRAP-type mannitol/chloroaromatic compound transport system permease small subunit